MDNETKLLTAVLRDKDAHVLLQANVGSILQTHNDIWEFIASYVNKNGSVPPESLVVENFRDFEPAKEVGTTAHHLESVQADYTDVKLRQILRDSAEDVQNKNYSDAISTLISETSSLKRVTSSVRDVDLVDLEGAVSHFEQVKNLNSMGAYGIKTGLPGFDAMLPSGITPGMLGVFLAYPGIGKSWLAMYFAVQAWKQGKKPLVVSLEMSEVEVRNRMYAIIGNGRWSLKNLGMGDVEIDEFKKWHGKEFFDRPPFYIVSSDNDDGEVNPAVVKSKIDQYRPDFVVLDYLQLMSPNTRTDNEVTRMKNLSRELKQLARTAEVPILAISSATPDDVTNLSQPPTLGQTAWSRQIAYDADWLLALGRDPNGDTVTATYRKNRHGPMNEFYVQCDFNYGRFVYSDDMDGGV